MPICSELVSYLYWQRDKINTELLALTRQYGVHVLIDFKMANINMYLFFQSIVYFVLFL